MIYTKPLLEIIAFDVEDIITESSSTPPTEPIDDELIVQVPSGGSMGSFEDFDDPGSPAPSYFKPF